MTSRFNQSNEYVFPFPSRFLLCCSFSLSPSFFVFSFVAVTTPNGFRIYSTDPFSKAYDSHGPNRPEDLQGDWKIVQMLGATSLVALVGSGSHPAYSPRKLRLFNVKTNSVRRSPSFNCCTNTTDHFIYCNSIQWICELNFATTVLNVVMNEGRLIAVLEEKLHIFDLQTMQVRSFFSEFLARSCLIHVFKYRRYML